MEKQNAGYANTHNQFWKVIKIAENAGDAYKPTNPDLSLAHLKVFHLTIEPTINLFDSTERLYAAAVKKRAAAFDALGARVQRAAFIAQSSSIAPHVIEKVVNYKSLIDGSNITQTAAKFKMKVNKAEKAILKGETVAMPVKGRSVSQQSMNLRLQNYKSMLGELTDDSNYTTHEADMTLGALQDFYVTLDTVNNTVVEAENAWKNKLAERNELIGGDTNSVKSMVEGVKNYFLGKAERKAGKEYKAIAAVKFFRVQVKTKTKVKQSA